MKFKAAIAATPQLKNAWKEGLSALRKMDRRHIKAENTRSLTGSADIDTALKPTQPTANRWDYAIAYQHTDRKEEVVYWVEAHTGSDDQIKVVLKKLDWLHNWLRSDGQKLDRFEREFIWVPSGPTSFTNSSTQIKTLATKGLRYSGSVFCIPDVRLPKPDRGKRA